MEPAQLQLHEVFDAATDILQAELKRCKQSLPHAHGAEKARLHELQHTIQQELQERKGAHSVLQQLLPIIQESNPNTWMDNAPILLSAAANAPSALQKELEALVAAGQRIAALRHAAPVAAAASGAAGTSTNQLQQHDMQQSPGQTQVSCAHVPSAGALQASTTAQTIAATEVEHTKQSTALGTADSMQEHQQQQQQQAHQGGKQSTLIAVGVEAKGADTYVGNEQLANEASCISAVSSCSQATSATVSIAAPSMTVQEAALQAYREEQRKLSKARRVLLGHGQANKPTDTTGASKAPAAVCKGSPSNTIQSQQQPQQAVHSSPAKSTAARNCSQATQPDSSGGAAMGLTHVTGARNATSLATKTVALSQPVIEGCQPPSLDHDHQRVLEVSQPPSLDPDQQQQQQQEAQHCAAKSEPAVSMQVLSNTAGTQLGVTVDFPSQNVSAAAVSELPPLQPDAVQDSPSSTHAEEISGHSAAPARDEQVLAPQALDVSSGSEAYHAGSANSQLHIHQPASPSSNSEASSYDYASDHGGSPAGTPQAAAMTAAEQQWGSSNGQAASSKCKPANEGEQVSNSASTEAALVQGRPVSAARAADMGLGTDRWADWEFDLLPEQGAGVSGWARDTGDDPLAQHLRAMASAPRAAAHAPPASLHLTTAAGNGVPALQANQPLSVSIMEAGSHHAQHAKAATATTCMTHSKQQPSTVQTLHPPANAPPQLPQQAQQPGPDAVIQNGNDKEQVYLGFARQGVVTALLRPQSASAPQPPGAPDVHAAVPQAAAGPGPKHSAAVNTSQAVSRNSAAGGQPGGAATTAAESDPAATAYQHYFQGFHEVLSAFSIPAEQLLQQQRGGSCARSTPPSYAYTEVHDKYQGLINRINAWNEALRRQGLEAQQHPTRPDASSQVSKMPTSGGCSPAGVNDCGLQPTTPRQQAAVGPPCTVDVPRMRYYAVADDTLHPEVRQVLQLALQGVPGWAPDPIDQITEEGKPDEDPNQDSTPATPLRSHHTPADAAAGTSGSPAQPDSTASTAAVTSRWSTQARSPLVGRCNMWNLMWSWSLKARAPLQDLLVWQKVNHFPEAKQLTRKDLLNKHLVRYQVMHGSNSRLGPLFACMPTTFALPKEVSAFQDAFARAAHGVEPSVTQPKGTNLWIVKPVGLSRGRGIRLIHSLRDLHASPQGAGSIDDPLVVQRYITHPLTVQGYKFDLRLYILVTSFNPLEAWLCREGFARFATQPFTLDSAQQTNRLVHLTNSSVQKGAAAAGELPQFLAQAQPYGGSKCCLSRLQQVLRDEWGLPWLPVWTRVTEVLTACLFAAQDAIPSCTNAFELFGADVMLDSSGGVWVLEINSSPSMSLDTPLDRQIKPRMVRDALAIVDPMAFDRDALLEVLLARCSTRGRGARRSAGPSFMSGSMSEERALMCSDIQQVLGGEKPRCYGDTPTALQQEHGTTAAQGTDKQAGADTQTDDNSNWFTCIAPSPLLSKLSKLRKGPS